MNRIVISSITSKLLRDKKYIDVFPEYYNLAKATENNLWHDNQNVLDHVISVFEGLENLLMFDELSKNKGLLLKKYLSEKIGGITREDVLKVAVLLHDIAIVDMLVKKPDGTITSPGHELISASRVRKYSDRFGLNKQSLRYVERIVGYHGLTSDLLSFIIINGNRHKYLKIFCDTVGNMDIELVLLMLSDDIGSDLKKIDQSLYNKRINILFWMLDELFKSHK